MRTKHLSIIHTKFFTICGRAVVDMHFSQFITDIISFDFNMACEKVASDLGLGCGFHRVLRFPLPVTTG